MILTIDFETVSAVDLKTRGMYRYAEDPTTDVYCLGVKVDANAPSIWLSPLSKRIFGEKDMAPFGEHQIEDEELAQWVKDADEIHAWNAGFERCMWSQVMVGRLGFPDIPIHKWRCTMAQASSFALPRGLDKCCAALGLPGKDKAGYGLMLKMCKQHKPLKAEEAWLRESGYRPHPDYTYGYTNDAGDLWFRWKQDPEDLFANCRYCMNDVDIEHRVANALPAPLSSQEQRVWVLDQIVNDTGVGLDLDAIDAIRECMIGYEETLLAEIAEITGGVLHSTKQRDATLAWLRAKGVNLAKLDRNTVTAALEDPNVTGDGRRLLELRQELAKASAAKVNKMADMACRDGRVRGLFRYCGADTGRWSGSGVQLQNLPRLYYPEAPTAFQLCNAEEIGLLYPNVLMAASGAVRPCLIAAPGHVFVDYDFSSIEGRVLAWLAGDEGILDAYRADLDMYKVAYSQAFDVEYDTLTKEQRTVGKPIELGLGFAGWIGALRSMGEIYEVEFPDDEECKRIILGWRDARVVTVRFWDALYAGCIECTKTGQPQRVGRISWFRDDWALYMRLPSGRCLTYPRPRTTMKEDQYGRTRPTFYAWTVDPRQWSPTYNQWAECEMWRGKIVENAVQAVARDLLAEAMLRLNTAGFRIVMHVHDEVVLEEPENNPREGEAADIMRQTPRWADGLPMGVGGWTGKRYRKD